MQILTNYNSPGTIGATCASPISSIAIEERDEFLADYTAWLWGSGSTCIRIEKNVGRMATALGVTAQITLLPRHIELAIGAEGNPCRAVIVRKTASCGISFDLNARLSRLSWELADGKVDFNTARARFNRIKTTSPTNRWEVLMLASLANAAFCRLFGGDAAAMWVVFFATMAGFLLKQLMLAAHRDVRLTVFCCAFVSATICVGARLFGWSSTPDIAIATSILYLIPGVPYLNSASDLIDRHYLCAVGRFADACVLTVCLSAGLAAALLLLGVNPLVN